MKKFAAYQTNNKRKFDGGGDFGGPDAKGGRFDRPKREKQKPREGREPELNIFIDKRFNFWNLPVKAKVILVSNLPQVINIKKSSNILILTLINFRMCASQIFFTTFSHFMAMLSESS